MNKIGAAVPSVKKWRAERNEEGTGMVGWKNRGSRTNHEYYARGCFVRALGTHFVYGSFSL